MRNSFIIVLLNRFFSNYLLSLETAVLVTRTHTNKHSHTKLHNAKKNSGVEWSLE